MALEYISWLVFHINQCAEDTSVLQYVVDLQVIIEASASVGLLQSEAAALEPDVRGDTMYLAIQRRGVRKQLSIKACWTNTDIRGNDGELITWMQPKYQTNYFVSWFKQKIIDNHWINDNQKQTQDLWDIFVKFLIR